MATKRFLQNPVSPEEVGTYIRNATCCQQCGFDGNFYLLGDGETPESALRILDPDDKDEWGLVVIRSGDNPNTMRFVRVS